MISNSLFKIHRFSLIILFSCLVTFFISGCTKKNADEIEFSFNSSFDGTIQKTAAFIPGNWNEKAKPLLVIAHYWGGNRFTAKKQGYYDACLKRGWYVICPELHGKNTDGTTSLAALGAQHDIIDSINHMKKNYNIDDSRIYLAGRSMGGMLAQIMAAKYPDVFAAVVAGMGVSDLKSWIDQNTQVQKGVIAECGNYAENPFEYHRRSSIYYAANFKYVPLILWHGTNDRIVPPEQTLNLFEKIKAANRFQPDVHWLHGAPHKAGNFTPEWVLNRLRYYQNISEPEDEIAGRSYTNLEITTDEKKTFFWLGIKPLREGYFAHVAARINNNQLILKTENTASVSIFLDKIKRPIAIKSYSVASDSKITVSLVENGHDVTQIEVENTASGQF